MLQDFLTRERQAILTVARQKATESKWAPLASTEEETRWTKLYDRFAAIVGTTTGSIASAPVVSAQDDDHLRLGFAVSEIVQTYSIIYRAITESAAQLGYTISAEEYHQLNISLDTAISDVVNDFERAHSLAQSAQSEEHQKQEAERLGFLVHELRNSLQSATLAFEMMQTGVLEPTGITAGILKRSLFRMGGLIDTALTGVRLKMEPELRFERVCAAEIINEVVVTASFLARTRDQTIRIQQKANPAILVDRPLLVSAVSNLVQNALKFTRSGGTVYVRTLLRGSNVVIEIEDECGGLDDSKVPDLFVAGTQMSTDRTGLGLGLTISRQAVERNKGSIVVTNLPGTGCIFSITLPLSSAS